MLLPRPDINVYSSRPVSRALDCISFELSYCCNVQTEREPSNSSSSSWPRPIYGRRRNRSWIRSFSPISMTGGSVHPQPTGQVGLSKIKKKKGWLMVRYAPGACHPTNQYSRPAAPACTCLPLCKMGSTRRNEAAEQGINRRATAVRSCCDACRRRSRRRSVAPHAREWMISQDSGVPKNKIHQVPFSHLPFHVLSTAYNDGDIDGPTVVVVNLMFRSFPTISDNKMVQKAHTNPIHFQEFGLYFVPVGVFNDPDLSRRMAG